jgi:hypothetical protein
MLSCLGRLAGIVAPFAGMLPNSVLQFRADPILGQKYLTGKSGGILWLGAGGIWLSALVMVFLPVEMKNRQMF